MTFPVDVRRAVHAFVLCSLVVGCSGEVTEAPQQGDASNEGSPGPTEEEWEAAVEDCLAYCDKWLACPEQEFDKRALACTNQCDSGMNFALQSGCEGERLQQVACWNETITCESTDHSSCAGLDNAYSECRDAYWNSPEFQFELECEGNKLLCNQDELQCDPELHEPCLEAFPDTYELD